MPADRKTDKEAVHNNHSDTIKKEVVDIHSIATAHTHTHTNTHTHTHTHTHEHTVQYHSAIKKDEILPSATT